MGDVGQTGGGGEMVIGLIKQVSYICSDERSIRVCNNKPFGEERIR